MKRNIVIAMIIAILVSACASKSQSGVKDDVVIDSAHNSRISLDWAGTYKGVIPAADAEGINVEITLNSDETYIITYQYIGKGDNAFTSSGNFKWNDDGSIIILDSDSLPPYYKVGENKLLQLDMAGNVITGQFADNYILKKYDNVK